MKHLFRFTPQAQPYLRSALQGAASLLRASLNTNCRKIGTTLTIRTVTDGFFFYIYWLFEMSCCFFYSNLDKVCDVNINIIVSWCASILRKSRSKCQIISQRFFKKSMSKMLSHKTTLDNTDNCINIAPCYKTKPLKLCKNSIHRNFPY